MKLVRFPESNPLNHEYLIEIAQKNIKENFVAPPKHHKGSKIALQIGDLVLLRVRHLSNALDKVTKKFVHLFE